MALRAKEPSFWLPSCLRVFVPSWFKLLTSLRRRLRRRGRDRRLRRRKPGDRHAVGRAGDVVEPDLLAELDRGGVAAMLAADAELQLLAGAAAALGGDADELANAVGVDRDERVLLEDALLLVGRQETRRVVAREAVAG